MKKTFITAGVVLSVLLLTACASTSDSESSAPKVEVPAGVIALETAQPCCTRVSELQFEPIRELDEIELSITTQDQVIELDGHKAFVKAFSLPEHNANLEIKLISTIDKTAFVPQVKMYDRNFNLTRTIPAEDFEYKVARWMWPDRFEGEFYPTISRLDPSLDEMYMVIYTPASALEKTTTVTHPSKSMAIAYGNEDPGMPDPVLANDAVGELTLKFKGQIVEAPKTQPTSVTAPTGAAESAAVATTSAVAAGAAVSSMQPETEAFYLEQIEQAVKDDQLDKAMKLVEEAERAGSTKARSHLLELLK